MADVDQLDPAKWRRHSAAHHVKWEQPGDGSILYWYRLTGIAKGPRSDFTIRRVLPGLPGPTAGTALKLKHWAPMVTSNDGTTIKSFQMSRSDFEPVGYRNRFTHAVTLSVRTGSRNPRVVYSLDVVVELRNTLATSAQARRRR